MNANSTFEERTGVCRSRRASLLDRLNLLVHAYRRIVTQTVYRVSMGKVGAQTTIFRPGFVSGHKYIFVGSRSLIRYGCRMEVILHEQPWIPKLIIGDDVNIEQNVHIICHDRVIIGNRVSITGHCAIVDVSHLFHGPDGGRKTGDAIDLARSCVEIGEGAFIGFGVTVLPNVRIGRFAVVGAGSVVTADIPDFAVAAGSPAKVIGSNKEE